MSAAWTAKPSTLERSKFGTSSGATLAAACTAAALIPLTLAAGAPGASADRAGTLNALLFPGPTAEFRSHRDAYGDTSVLRSQEFFYGLRPETEYVVDLEPGVQLLIALEAISEPDARGLRTVLKMADELSPPASSVL